MGRLALGVAGGVLAAASITLVIAACGSDDSTGGTSPDSGTTTPGSTPGTTPGSTPGKTPSNGADSGSNTPPSAAGTSNPTQISCGTASCDGGSFFPGPNFACCVRDGVTSCERQNDCDGDDDIQLRCDEPADCPATFGEGNVPCCLRQQAGGGQVRAECSQLGSECAIELCKTNADCLEGTACTKKKCRGVDVFVCGSPNGCQ